MTVTCAHPRCRTSLDELPVTCPHGLPFCGGCTWEEGCTECAVAANVGDLGGALARSVAEARSMDRPTLGPEARCLCGSSDTRARILAAPVDLTGVATAPLRNEGGRPCNACGHYIHHGAQAVVRYFGDTTTVRDHYHPECVVTA